MNNKLKINKNYLFKLKKQNYFNFLSIQLINEKTVNYFIYFFFCGNYNKIIQGEPKHYNFRGNLPTHT